MNSNQNKTRGVFIFNEIKKKYTNVNFNVLDIKVKIKLSFSSPRSMIGILKFFFLCGFFFGKHGHLCNIKISMNLSFRLSNTIVKKLICLSNLRMLCCI